MNVREWRKPFRIGTTSYIIEDDLVANATFLAPHVEEMQLVLFDLPDGPSNVPDSPTVEALAAIGRQHSLTYTVHLLDDLLDWAPGAATPDGRLHPSVHSAQKLIDRTLALDPWAWVGHLDGRGIRERGLGSDELPMWRAQVAHAIHQVGTRMREPHCLAIENLEGYPPDFVMPVVEQTRAARCVDVGHLWLDGCDPCPHLQAAWPRLRVVHLHGVVERTDEPHRDHRSLAVTPPKKLDAVVHFLLRSRYAGVLTLEVFGEEDFRTSLDALHASICRFDER